MTKKARKKRIATDSKELAESKAEWKKNPWSQRRRTEGGIEKSSHSSTLTQTNIKAAIVTHSPHSAHSHQTLYLSLTH